MIRLVISDIILLIYFIVAQMPNFIKWYNYSFNLKLIFYFIFIFLTFYFKITFCSILIAPVGHFSMY